VILSLPSLEESFEDPNDGYHVGYHEFAHILDQGDGEGRAGGLPSNVSGPFAAQLQRALERAGTALRMGASPLDPYGLESAAELWAVAVEGFIELSSALADAHPDLHQLLDLYFNQRPRH
jgi:Mlc titration factor MtfA (ptsG expression regulator)